MNMTARQFLEPARRLDWRIEKKYERIARMRAKLQKATSNLTGMPRGGSDGDWTDADVAVLEYEEQIKAEIARLCALKRRITEIISTVDESTLRDLLELRYLNGYRFEQIAVEMNFSYDYVRHLHKEALAAVQVKLDTQKHINL